MHVTRRLWGVAALAAGLAALAVVLARPILLAGTALLGAWLLGRQFLFVRAITRTADSLTVAQTPAQTGVRTDASIPVTLSATLETPSRLALELEAGLPTATTATDEPTLRLRPGEAGRERTVDVRWPIAGTHRFDRATLRVTDGLFAERLPVGGRPTVTVEPRSPRELHVGAGGDRVATAYGEHDGGRLGSGIDPAEVREYAPGDTADRIDWKATARLGTPHVREREPDTDRRTLLVVDHRGPLGIGAEETKLEHLREVALSIAGTARRVGDPIGLLTVGDGGVTNRLEPSTAPGRYTTVRRQLLDLEATDPEVNTRRRGPTGTGAARRQQPSPATVRRALADLEAETDAFAERLRPFYERHRSSHERIETEPLYGAVRTALAGRQRGVWTVLCTDDSNPGELREAVGIARSEGGSVLVLLAPSVLYEPAGLSDLEAAYDRYVAFEELRRELARLPAVTALEIGPGDRLAAVLASGRDRRRREVTAGE